jgi:hypothetical protein
MQGKKKMVLQASIMFYLTFFPLISNFFKDDRNQGGAAGVVLHRGAGREPLASPLGEDLPSGGHEGKHANNPVVL